MPQTASQTADLHQCTLKPKNNGIWNTKKNCSTKNTVVNILWTPNIFTDSERPQAGLSYSVKHWGSKVFYCGLWQFKKVIFLWHIALFVVMPSPHPQIQTFIVIIPSPPPKMQTYTFVMPSAPPKKKTYSNIMPSTHPKKQTYTNEMPHTSSTDADLYQCKASHLLHRCRPIPSPPPHMQIYTIGMPSPLPTCSLT